MPAGKSLLVRARHQAWDRTNKTFDLPDPVDGTLYPGLVRDTPGLVTAIVERPKPETLCLLGFNDVWTTIRPLLQRDRVLVVCIGRSTNKGVALANNVALVVFDLDGNVMMCRGLTTKGTVVAEEIRDKMQPIVKACSIVPF